MRIALVSMTVLDQDDFDEVPLARALEARGFESVRVGWDDPRVDWSGFDAALLRSTWDYHHRRDEFLLWARRAAAETRLFNPPDLIEWNSHKFYLRELEHAGIAIVPTVFLERGSAADLPAILEHEGWDAAVIKPAVSADSFATERAERLSPEAGQRHLDQHLAERDMLVQVYMPAVVEPGERCLVAIDGEVSHAVRKRSKFLGGRHAGPEGVPVPVEADEGSAAENILKRIGHPPLYARIDLIRDGDGVPRLMELELVEPSLFFAARPGAAEALVEALASRLLF
ncbi:MAG: hypothetical protein ABI609_13695 [Acidobacteriota bacterium]